VYETHPFVIQASNGVIHIIDRVPLARM